MVDLISIISNCKRYWICQWEDYHRRVTASTAKNSLSRGYPLGTISANFVTPEFPHIAAHGIKADVKFLLDNDIGIMYNTMIIVLC